MRLKKGSIIEVWSKNELPSGLWRCAEVVCGNGHTYTVKYKLDTWESDEAMERVSRNFIRPSPPAVELLENWAPGDVLEVCQNFSWKMATVCKVLGRNSFLVRFVGFSHEFKVCGTDLRVRQSWQDGKWFIIGKNIGKEKGKCSERSLRNQNQQLSSQVKRVERMMNPYAKDDFYAARNRTESPIIALGKRRGSSHANAEVEVPAKKARKRKVVEMDDSPHCLPEKVVTIVSRQENLGEKKLYTALSNQKIQLTNLAVKREVLDEAVGRSCEIRLKPSDDNITCSVGSCSITSNDFFKPRTNFSECPIDAECSDAESVCYGDSDEGNCLPTQKECAKEIRRLELQAYRCTMEALHACGPLSWEQETLVTNLRLSLNISNDEHLVELRHLASTTTSISFR